MSQPFCGMLLVDKSPGFTSHHVVAYIRKLLKNNLKTDVKVGHLGTLDPFASGLLPILIGGVTRLSDEMMGGKKQYLFQIQLGEETDTLDTAGRVVETKLVPENYHQKVLAILPKFTGEIEQIPPVYSAIKMQGRPLYEYMRAEGKLPQEIETKKRKIWIDKIEVIKNIDGQEKVNCITLRVLCSKGTYVRCLARDISKAIGTVGHCCALRRESVLPWHVEQALLFSEDTKPCFNDLEKHIISPYKIFPELPALEIPDNLSKLFCSGNIITIHRNELSQKFLEIVKKTPFCFAKSNSDQVLFYSHTEIIDSEFVKIRPNKKII